MATIEQIAFWNSPVPQLMVCPVSNLIEAANKSACQLLQVPLAELKQTHASSWFNHCFTQLVVFTQETMMNGHAWSDTLSVKIAEQETPITLETLASQVELEGRQMIQFVFQDVEKIDRNRVQSDAERHYRSGIGQWQRMARIFQDFERENQLILDAAGEGIYGVDANGQATFINPAAERILGFRGEELIGRNIHTAIHYKHCNGNHYHVEDCPIYAAFQEGEVRQVDDDVFWSKSGVPIDVEYTSTPIKDGDQVVGAVVIFRDITEKKRAQRELVQALKEVDQLRQQLEMENAYLQEEISSEFNNHQIVGRSQAVRELVKQINLVAPTDVTVLICGESGTGKELIARAIHESSKRSKRSLIRVNCAAIPAELFESEFFGHAKGSFTGATSDRPGRFELAHGGTLFLDEVGEIPLALQGKLLRVLQEQQLERIGESSTRNVDVRIIAATNRNLAEMVAAGTFREDLYFRLNVFPIESAPLRQRADDIPLLAQHFLDKAGKRLNKPDMRISLAQLETLKRYDWPGNIRELENVIERQVILAHGQWLKFDDLQTETQQRTELNIAESAIVTASDLKQHERQSIINALKQARGKVFGRDGAAEIMGVKPTTLASRIKRLGIDVRLFKGEHV
ncbi:sigma-54 interaction domain-containing protein [Neiella litorisoli]|nr:sigma 54-interacting transcriptional regulator [Neiella litorisoli]